MNVNGNSVRIENVKASNEGSNAVSLIDGRKVVVHHTISYQIQLACSKVASTSYPYIYICQMKENCTANLEFEPGPLA